MADKINNENNNDKIFEEIPNNELPFKSKKKKFNFNFKKIKTTKIKEEDTTTTNTTNKKAKKKFFDFLPKGKLDKKQKALVAFGTLVWIGVFVMVVGLICGGIVLGILLQDKPELHAQDLKSPDSSIIYDSNGEKIMELGLYLRENIDYDEMPNSLIDAFVSIEDSRFFEHIGFDVPRFAKAFLVNLGTGDFSQGGSTLTMQLVKNSYFSVDDGINSKLAARSGLAGIKRKIQEIVMSIDLTLTNKASKKDVIAMYINKVNYGNNIRGVEKAAQYYFGKSANELNLSESAFLAGVVNSPNSVNPYNNKYQDEEWDYLEAATNRRNEVLNLMLYHGYINETECELAKSIKIEDMLVGESDNFFETNEYCQGYIDRVIDEVIDTTGENPYVVGMNIYTNMDSYMQKLVYDMQNEEEYTGIEFPSDIMQNAIVVMNNQDGSIIALGGGRGETQGARQLNRATDSYLNPGSSIKPVFDYSLAFEKLGWATDHVLTDQPLYLYSGNALIANFDRVYFGDVTVLEAVERSINTTAVQTLSQVIDATSEEWVVDYLNSIGFEFSYDDFDLQFAIGGNRCLITPLQLAGAHAIFMNKGMYVTPHTVNHIEYVDGREDYVADTVGHRAISEESAWLTAYLEYNVISGGNYSSAKKIEQDYPVYAKTGTTDWGEGSAEFNVPAASTKDCWLVAQTNKYTISTWIGYDKLQMNSYFTNAEYNANTKSDIVKLLLEELEKHFTKEDGYDPYPGIEKPEGITTITHTLGAVPYTYSTGRFQTSTGYIAKSSLDNLQMTSEDALLASLPVKDVCSFVSDLQGGISPEGNAVLTFAVTQQTGNQVGTDVDVSTTNVYKETTHALSRSYFPHYNYNIIDNSTAISFEVVYDNDDGEEVVVATGSTMAPNASIPLPSIHPNMRACAWTGADHNGRFCNEIN